jgi:ABC-2 type transport system ATP-binding protein
MSPGGSGAAAIRNDALTFNGVTHKYAERTALANVTLSIRPAEMFGLIGPDGAGKTTAIRLACGLLRPDGGEVRVFGHDPAGEHRTITALVGYLSQRFSLYGDLTIDENIAFQAEIHGVRGYAAERDRLLEMTQLTPFRGRRADRLSGGMKQKLALACTLIHRPKLLLLDEPTTGVDPVSRREFWKLLSEFLASGLTIVMATPYLDEAERCGRVALLNEGAVMALDEPSSLQASLPGSLVEVEAAGARPPVEALAAIEGVDDVQLFGDRAHVRLHRQQDDAPQYLSGELARTGIEVAAIRAIPASLEDVFIHLVSRPAAHAAPAGSDR